MASCWRSGHQIRPLDLSLSRLYIGQTLHATRIFALPNLMQRKSVREPMTGPGNPSGCRRVIFGSPDWGSRWNATGLQTHPPAKDLSLADPARLLLSYPTFAARPRLRVPYRLIQRTRAPARASTLSDRCRNSRTWSDGAPLANQRAIHGAAMLVPDMRVNVPL